MHVHERSQDELYKRLVLKGVTPVWPDRPQFRYGHSVDRNLHAIVQGNLQINSISQAGYLYARGGSSHQEGMIGLQSDLQNTLG